MNQNQILSSAIIKENIYLLLTAEKKEQRRDPNNLIANTFRMLVTLS